jgi:hypothetical protein
MLCCWLNQIFLHKKYIGVTNVFLIKKIKTMWELIQCNLVILIGLKTIQMTCKNII